MFELNEVTLLGVCQHVCVIASTHVLTVYEIGQWDVDQWLKVHL